MIIDCHVHTNPKPQDKGEIIKRLDTAKIDKMVLLSFHPASFSPGVKKSSEIFGSSLSPNEALKQVMEWKGFSSDRIIPFFWIDPLEEDAINQVDKAVDAGVSGFKVISNRFFPGDEKPMKVWHHIAKTNKPILFHSGILYGSGAWSKFNRPLEFEPLFEVPSLRFALAHVSWPWHDECLAVFGHWQSRKERGTSTAEMFIDTTPGTPGIYRNEVFNKIFNIGYDCLEDNLIFGTDCNSDYDTDYAEEILAMDKKALDFAKATTEQREKYYSKNILKFLHG